MGRNGKEVSIFSQFVNFMNNNIGNTVKSADILLGHKPSRRAETAYLYKFIKLGYIEQITKTVMDPEATYRIAKEVPAWLNSQKIKQLLKTE